MNQVALLDPGNNGNGSGSMRLVSEAAIRRCGQKVGLNTLKREIERCIQKNNITKLSRFMKRRDQ